MELDEHRKKLLRNRRIGCFAMGWLSTICLKNICNNLLTTITLEDKLIEYIFVIPVFYSIIVLFLLDKFINDDLYPDKDFMHGSLICISFLVMNNIITPFIRFFNILEFEYLKDRIGFLFIRNIAPCLTLLVCLYAWFYICDLRYKWKLRLAGEYDDVIEQYKKEVVELKKKELQAKRNKNKSKKENNEEIKEEDLNLTEKDLTPDILDIGGGFIKKFSKKLEDNIKK